MITTERGTDNQPQIDCPLCPRLVSYRLENRAAEPTWHNGPVHSFGELSAPLLIVGLAPGRTGANRTGRPFTGDYAGDLLYATLLKLDLARGHYEASKEDGFRLKNCRITNAVRCAPPQNKPTPQEIKLCGDFLRRELTAMSKLKAIMALGRIAHEAVLRALALKSAQYPFTHGACHPLPSGLVLGNSYHCSRYNTNTGRLTASMFEQAFLGLLGAI